MKPLMTSYPSCLIVSSSNPRPPQLRLITLPRPTPPPRPMRFLRILPPLLPLPNKELNNPRRRRQKHDPNRHPRNNQILSPTVRIRTNIIPILIDDMHGLAHNVCDECGGDHKAEEAQGGETPVSEGDEAGAVREDGDEGGEDGDAGGGDADGVQDEDGVEGDVEGVETVLDVVGPVDVREVEVEGADFELLAENFVEVEIICRNRISSCILLGPGDERELTHCGSVGAGCDVLAGAFGGGIWLVVSLAHIHQMQAVPLSNTEFFRQLVCNLCQQVAEIILDVVDSILDFILSIVREVCDPSFDLAGG